MASKKVLQLGVEELQSKIDNLELVVAKSFDDIRKDMDKLSTYLPKESKKHMDKPSSAKTLMSSPKKRQTEEHKQTTQPMLTKCSGILFFASLILLVADIAIHFL